MGQDTSRERGGRGRMVDERNARSVWIPWLCLPLLLLLDLRLFVASFSLDLALLQIPIAVLLASRFGRHGFAVAIVACTPPLNWRLCG